MANKNPIKLADRIAQLADHYAKNHTKAELAWSLALRDVKLHE